MQNEQMLEYIRNYYIESDVVVPRRASVPGFNLRVLSKRLHDARNVFLVLIDNNMFVDACLIAGHILEVSATMHYIRSAADKMLNSRRYVAKSSANVIYDMLQIDTSNLQDKQYRELFQEFLEHLKDTGHLIVKAPKKADKHKFNAEMISKLSSIDRDNVSKRKLIKENYEMPIVNDYLNCFIRGMQKKLKENTSEDAATLEQAIRLFYVSYCRFKHASALMYPGVVENEQVVIKEPGANLTIPAVFLSLDMLSDKPVYLK